MKIFVSLFIALLILIMGYMAHMLHWMGEVSVGAPILAGMPEKPALIVIDIQEGITGKLSKSRGHAAQSGPLIENVNRIIGAANAKQIPVIYIRHENTGFLLNLLSGWQWLAAGTPGAALDKRLSVVSPNLFVKNRNDAFWNPEFDKFLRSQGVNKLYMTGLDAAQCVDRTIKGALARGYKVSAIKDAIISSSKKKRDEMLVLYAKEGVELLTADNWLSH